MANEKIVKYIRAMLKRRHSLQEIKKILLDQKLPLKQINEAISFVNQTPAIKKASKPTSVAAKQNTKPLSYKLKYNTRVFLGVIFVIIFIVIFLFILTNSSKHPKSIISVSEFSLNEGVYVNLSKSSEITFTLGELKYTLIANSIKNNSVCFQGAIDERCFIQGEGEKFVDLNGDSQQDLIVRVDKIEDNLGFLFFKKYGSSVCFENWDCTAWGICLGGIKKRVCVDLNSCGTISNKPVIQNLCFNNSNQTYYYSFPGESIDCGAEEETFVNQCFLDAAENCDFAEIIAYSSIEINPVLSLFGENISSNFSSQMEIRGLSEDGNCTFYEKILRYSNSYHPDYFNYLLESGNYTLEEILAMEVELNNSMQSMIGLWTECSYNPEGFIAMLNSYFSYGPLGELDCSYENSPDDSITYVSCVYEGVELKGVCFSGID